MVVIGAMGVLGGLAVVFGPAFTQADLLAPLAAVVAGVGAFALLHGARAAGDVERDRRVSRRTVLLAGGAAVGVGRAGVGGRRGAAQPAASGPRAPTSPPLLGRAKYVERATPRARGRGVPAAGHADVPHRRTASSTGSTRRCGCRRSRPRTGACACTAWSAGSSRCASTTWSDRPLVERTITMTCVSNPIGGNLHLDGELRRRAAARRAAGGGHRARRRPAVLDELGRLVHRHPDGDRAGARPRRAAGDRDERRGAALRARVPGAHGRAGPLRVRVGHEVVGRPGGHHVRRPREAGLLAAARLVAARADQDDDADRQPGGLRAGGRRTP